MNEKLKARIAAINSGKVPKGYKKTKVGIVPVEWETKKLGEVLYKVSNGVEVKNDTLYQQIGIRSHGKGIFYKEIVFGSELGNKSVFWVEPDCFVLNIVFAWEQAIGRTTKKEIGMIASHRFPMFKPSGIDVDYLVLYLLTKRGTVLLDLASPGGAGRNRTLGQDAFLNSKVSLPPLPEQQKIAEILSTQDKLIELHEKKIEQLKELKKGYLQKMFPKKGSKYPELRLKGFTDAWEQRKLGDISDSYSGGTPTAGKSEYYGGDIPFIRSAEVNSDSTELFLTEEGLKNSSAKMVNKGDILYALYGATSGEVGLARLNGAINQAILDIKPHANYDAQFIMQWLRKSKENIISTYLQGGQGNLSGTIVTSLMVDCPTYSEQQKIGDYFRNLDNLITLHQRKLEQEKQKKKALMQLLLTGKVRCV